MQLRRKSRMTSEVSTHSLNDIMFFLMLFFLIMSTMVMPSAIKINLPKTDAGQSLRKDKNILLAVDSNMNYYLNSKPVMFEELEPQLTEIVANDTAVSTMVLQASKSIKLQDLVDVMAVGSKMKMKIVLATTNR